MFVNHNQNWTKAKQVFINHRGGWSKAKNVFIKNKDTWVKAWSSSGWEMMGVIPHAQYKPESVAYRGEYYGITGLKGSGSTILQDYHVNKFNPITKTWTEMAIYDTSIGSANEINNPSIIRYGGDCHLFGFYYSGSGYYSSSTGVFNIEQNKWLKSPVPYGYNHAYKKGHTLIEGSTRHFFGGGMDYSGERTKWCLIKDLYNKDYREEQFPEAIYGFYEPYIASKGDYIYILSTEWDFQKGQMLQLSTRTWSELPPIPAQFKITSVRSSAFDGRYMYCSYHIPESKSVGIFTFDTQSHTYAKLAEWAVSMDDPEITGQYHTLAYDADMHALYVTAGDAIGWSSKALLKLYRLG